MTQPFTIAFIGAGSLGFTRGLLRDVLSVPEFAGIDIAFHDIDARNLDIATRLAQRDIDANQLGVRIRPTLDRREALRGARYVFCMARVGGLEAAATDVGIPLAYGVDQGVGDTLCAGGVMYGQRGIAFMLGLCEDIRDVAEPDALLLNYCNPMAMMTWAAIVHGRVRCVGLCHGVQNTRGQIAGCVELWAKRERLIPPDGRVEGHEIDVVAAGINHQTWFVQARWRGIDLIPRMLELFEGHDRHAAAEKVRVDVLRRFGHYSTESNGHLSEYLPWYRKRRDEIGRWTVAGCWNSDTAGYLKACVAERATYDADPDRLLTEEPMRFGAGRRGAEHASYILEGLETGRVYRGHFDVVNQGCIANLADDAIVEVPGYVDRNGIGIPRVGELPPGCAAVCTSSINVQRLAVRAAVTGDVALLKQAVLLDPLTGAVCDPPEVWQLVDELLVAQERWLPQYRTAIPEARRRIAEAKADGSWIPARCEREASALTMQAV
jgi:alpha-galactosidase